MKALLMAAALVVVPSAHADVSDSGGLTLGGGAVISGTMTVQSNAFSVGGATLAVVGGSVGIGTAAPGAKLEINGFPSGQGLRVNYGSSTGQISAIDLYSNGSSGGQIGLQMVDSSNADLWLGSSAGRALTVYRNGNIGIGTASPSKPLTITANSSGAAMIQISNTNNTAGDNGYVAGVGPNSSESSSRYLDMYDSGFNTSMGFISRNGSNAVAYNTSSDRRLKENIVPTKTGLAALLQLQVHDYKFKSDAAKTVTQGLIAQEVRKVYSAAVATNGDKGTEPLVPKARVWGIDYGRLTPLLIQAIQDQQELIQGLTKRVAALEAARGK